MAAGDPVTEIGSVAGGGDVTLTVASGETWVLSSVGGPNLNMTWAATDGTTTALFAVGAGSTNGPVGLDQRTVIDGDVGDARVDNNGCSSSTFVVSGREI